MRLIAALLFLGLLTLIGSRFATRRWTPPRWIKQFFDSGLAFVFLGLTVGPAGLSILDEAVLEQLRPIVLICLGWIGFLFGIHLEGKRLVRIPARLWLVILGESSLTLLLVLTAMFLFFIPTFIHESFYDQRWPALLTIAVCAAGTAPGAVFLFTSRPGFPRPLGRALRLVATLDDLPGLLVFGLLFAWWPTRPLGPFETAAGLLWTLLYLPLGLLLGFLLKSTAALARREQTHFLAVLGTIAFGAGLAARLQLSPLVLGAVAGAAFANTAGKKEAIYALLVRSEHPIFVLFMILVGCQWTFASGHLIGLTALYLTARLLGKALGGAGVAWVMAAPERRYYLSGLGLLGQGGMAVAMAIDYARAYPSAISATLVTVLLLGVLGNELFASLATLLPFGRQSDAEARSRR
ncbi:MAG: hypothetical protein GX444_17370 [Myxococcales bacterium]|nr:hypothetical protein [Myxococcales bacterium]